jgi:hypothetical protein
MEAEDCEGDPTTPLFKVRLADVEEATRAVAQWTPEISAAPIRPLTVDEVFGMRDGEIKPVQLRGEGIC